MVLLLKGKEGYYVDLKTGEVLNLMDSDWDYLIILDACRYDYFRGLYESLLKNKVKGKLRKVCSPASNTIEWAKKVFKGKYPDVVYVSANPWINSKVPIAGFYAGEHFYRIVDIWERGWDDELSTVHPKVVNSYVKIIRKLYPRKKLIIHYLQPHFPYIVFQRLRLNNYNKLFDTRPTGIQAFQKRSFTERIKGFLFWRRVELVEKAFKNRDQGNLKFATVLGKIAYKVSDTKSNPTSIVGTHISIKALRLAYSHNLMLVMLYVLRLLKEIVGRILIISDHGELLGEYYLFDHFEGSNIPELRIVPWLEIKTD